MCVELDGPPCPCGARGCLEVIAQRDGDRGARGAGRVATAVGNTGRGRGRRGGRAARAGDTAALASFDRSAKALAAAIAGTAALVDIEAAVIGGGVAKSGELLFGPLREHLKEYARLSFTRDVTVQLASALGDAGLIGAAALVGHAAV